jgi:hypothetical protein
VFSANAAPLPFAADDYRTRRYALTAQNFSQVVQASCSIPFVLRAVHDIAGAPRGAYWDGGITDYHLHLDYRKACKGESERERGESDGDTSAKSGASAENGGIVLYPHFQKNIVPGWLDKSLKWRHKSTHFLDDVVVLAPNPEWVKTLPNGKLPDRNDFMHYGRDTAARVDVWQRAVAESQRLRDEFAALIYSRDAVANMEAL